MKRYIKAVLGGLLAVAAAFGWVVAIAFVLMWKVGVGIWGIEMPKGVAIFLPLLLLLLVFAAGFHLAFRAAYHSNKAS